MLSRTKRFAAAGAAAAIVALALSTPAHAEATRLMLANKTPFTLQFYIDGQPACSASPDKYCIHPTSAGTRAVMAKRTDAEETLCETKIEVPAGLYIWACEVPR